MKRLLSMVLLLLLVSTCGFTFAESELTTVYLGNYEYDVDSTWAYDVSEEGFNYHYETGDAYTGAYFMTSSEPSNINGLTLTELEIEAKILLDIYSDAFVNSSEYSQYVEIDIDVDGHAGILPHRAFSTVLTIDETAFDMLVYMWVDWDNIYSITYTDPTITREEANEQFIEILNRFYRSGTRPITIEGTGVTITDNISIKSVPSRITFEQSEKGEFDVSCIFGNDDYSVVSGYNTDTYGSDVINKAGDYTFMIESEEDWKLTIERMNNVEFESKTGEGDYVSDIYNIDKPCIVTLDAEFYDHDNLFLYAYVETDYGWDREYLLNELESGGFSKEFKSILKISKPTKVYFVLDFDEGKWKLDLQ